MPASEAPTYSFRNNTLFAVFWLEGIFPRTVRRLVRWVSGLGALGAFLLWVLRVGPLSPARVFGISLVCFAIWLVVLALGFFVSSRIRGNALGIKALSGASFSARFSVYAAELIYRGVVMRRASAAHSLTFLQELPRTRAGHEFLRRLGGADAYVEYVGALAATDAPPMQEIYRALDGPGSESIPFADLIHALFDASDTYTFFMRQNITSDDVLAAARWVETLDAKAQARRLWWRREYLGRVQGLAKNWAYGFTPFLEQFIRSVSVEGVSREIRLVGVRREQEVLEAGLQKVEGANVLIVGEPGSGKAALLHALISSIDAGRVFPKLEHKRVLMLYTSAITAAGKTKGEVEEILIRILREATRAGNIIFVIEDFPEFVQSLSVLGISVAALFEPFLSSSRVHIIALANTGSFRRFLAAEGGLNRYFEKIELTEPSEEDIRLILQDLVPHVEVLHRGAVTITYPALSAITESAVRYLVSPGLPQRAVDLLDDVARAAASEGVGSVTKEYVLKMVQQKTDIPLGAVSGEEQETLLNLEARLHERVIGQEEAISTVADAIRRARAGIQTKRRPIGTFLFFGPTGVGKTETAKALSENYFGSEQAMVRLDMTEFQNEAALGRLLGSGERREAGILANKMRSTPYAVLLLDEFEKSHQKVMDLFLQILDEGFFTDALGKRVNMRQTIIIATSNAASSFIFDAVERGVDPETMKKDALAVIQQEGIFRPELLNRFDGIVLFRPLKKEELGRIARLLLNGLATRLAEKSITLEITDELIASVVEGGYNPAFGARPMRRFIQDEIEDRLAKQIIDGSVAPGSTIVFSGGMFQNRG